MWGGHSAYISPSSQTALEISHVLTPSCMEGSGISAGGQPCFFDWVVSNGGHFAGVAWRRRDVGSGPGGRGFERWFCQSELGKLPHLSGPHLL